MKLARPCDTPLAQWSTGWLNMECGSLLDLPLFLIMEDHEKQAAGYPVSDAEMREFIAARRAA